MYLSIDLDVPQIFSFLNRFYVFCCTSIFHFKGSDFHAVLNPTGFELPLPRPNDSESVFDRDCPSFSGKKTWKSQSSRHNTPKGSGRKQPGASLGKLVIQRPVCCWGAQKLNDYI